jgi:hypothetical protein
MNIEELTLKEIREIQAMCAIPAATVNVSCASQYPVGKNVIVRTA